MNTEYIGKVPEPSLPSNVRDWIKANWLKWAYIPTVTIEEACFLSMGLEPDKGRKFDDLIAISEGKRPKEYGDQATAKELKRRLDIAHANLPNNGGNIPVFGFRKCNWMAGGTEPTVKLSEFGAWAKSIVWELPEEFPIGGVQNAVSSQDKDELSKAYKLIALLVKRLCDKKTVNQTALAAEIEKEGIRGLGKTNINTIFSNANKELKKE